MKYKKVIFLDIDGVLNINFSFPKIFDPKAVALLRALVEKHKAVIIISSAWRKHNWPERVLDAFKKTGWDNPPIVGRTPILHTLRGEEIKLWLSRNKVEQFVIIDDDTDILVEQLKYFVRCHNRYGLTKKQAKMIDKIFS